MEELLKDALEGISKEDKEEIVSVKRKSDNDKDSVPVKKAKPVVPKKADVSEEPVKEEEAGVDANENARSWQWAPGNGRPPYNGGYNGGGFNGGGRGYGGRSYGGYQRPYNSNFQRGGYGGGGGGGYSNGYSNGGGFQRSYGGGGGNGGFNNGGGGFQRRFY